MDKQRLILVPNSLSPFKIARLFPDTRWIFFGREYLDRLKWEKALGEDLKINYKEQLTNSSYALRDEYVEWSAELGRSHWVKWEWWITRLATRNNLASPLFLYVCYLEVLKGIAKERAEPLIIISENWELLDTISSHWGREWEIVRPFYWQQWINRTNTFVKEKLHFVLSWCRFFMKSFSEWLASRLTKVANHPKPDHVYAPNHIVIHTAIDDVCLGDDGRFRDRFYPGLAEYLRNRGLNVSTLIWIFNVNKINIFEIFRWFRKNKESFLIPQDYYSLIDCFRSFLSVVKSSTFEFQNEKCIFKGINLFSLINYEQKLQSMSTWTAYFINQIRIFENWKRLGYCMKAYIDTWELKNCEVPALIGIKKKYPLCKTIAYQHGAMIPKLLFFNYKTTEDEFKSSPHADIGIANSKINKEFLGKEGFPVSFIELGPALRFKYLETQQDSVIDNNNGKRGILVCLPLKFSSACEMLEICYKVSAAQQNDFKIWIKSHPMMKFSALKKRLSFSWPENFELVEGSMEKWLSRSKVVIASDSNTMVESVYRGIGTVVIGKEADIDIIPLDIVENNNSWKLVYESDKLKDAVKYLYFEKRECQKERNDSFFEFDMNLVDRIFNS